MEESKLRIAIINKEKCKPKNCKLECKRACPVNKSGKLCITVEKTSVTCEISEEMCIGCGLCV
jgi:ATP-binding cassette subfamily E protein 1